MVSFAEDGANLGPSVAVNEVNKPAALSKELFARPNGATSFMPAPASMTPIKAARKLKPAIEQEVRSPQPKSRHQTRSPMTLAVGDKVKGALRSKDHVVG